MRHSLRSRVLIAAVAVMAGSAAPAVALAHGANHAREAAHDTPEHHQYGPENETVPAAGQSLHPADSHGHPVLELGNTKRLSAAAAIPLIAQAKALHGWFASIIVLSPVGNERVTGKMATGPPPSLRAPPPL